MIHLETARLTLSTWDHEDWQRFKPIATDPRVMRFITGGRPWSDDEIRDFVERTRRVYSQQGFCRWKLEEKASGELAGFCGLGFVHSESAPEIGWWLGPSYWGRGLATEAAQAAFADGRERAGLGRIVSIAHPENHASIRIMRRLGMQYETAYEYRENPVVRYAWERTAGS